MGCQELSKLQGDLLARRLDGELERNQLQAHEGTQMELKRLETLTKSDRQEHTRLLEQLERHVLSMRKQLDEDIPREAEEAKQRVDCLEARLAANAARRDEDIKVPTISVLNYCEDSQGELKQRSKQRSGTHSLHCLTPLLEDHLAVEAADSDFGLGESQLEDILRRHNEGAIAASASSWIPPSSALSGTVSPYSVTSESENAISDGVLEQVRAACQSALEQSERPSIGAPRRGRPTTRLLDEFAKAFVKAQMQTQHRRSSEPSSEPL